MCVHGPATMIFLRSSGGKLLPGSSQRLQNTHSDALRAVKLIYIYRYKHASRLERVESYLLTSVGALSLLINGRMSESRGAFGTFKFDG